MVGREQTSAYPQIILRLYKFKPRKKILVRIFFFLCRLYHFHISSICSSFFNIISSSDSSIIEITIAINILLPLHTSMLIIQTFIASSLYDNWTGFLHAILEDNDRKIETIKHCMIRFYRIHQYLLSSLSEG